MRFIIARRKLPLKQGTTCRMESKQVRMNNFTRVAEYFWRYKARFLVSVVCALGIAALWCANLSAVYPVVNVLFEEESIPVYIRRNIEQNRQEVAARTKYLATVDESEFEKRARLQRKISEASRSVQYYSWLNEYIVPLVPEDKFRTLSLILALVVVSTVLKCALIYLQELLVGSVIYRATNDIRTDCFEACLRLDSQAIAYEGSANLMARMTNDIMQLAVGYSAFGTKLIREPLKAAACIGAAFYLNWRLTLLALVVVPVIGIFLSWVGRKLKKAAHRAMQSIARIYDCISETFESFRIVTAFSGHDRQMEKFNAANDDYYRQTMKMVKVHTLIRPITELCGVIAVMLAFAPGAYLVLKGTKFLWGVQLAASQLTITDVMTLYVFLAGTLDPLRKLSSVFGVIKQGLAGADRVFQLVDQESTVPEVESPMVMVRHAESVTFENITYRYPNLDTSIERIAALSNVNLKVRSGEVVAVVGPNGSGKSTLLALLPRFMDADGGTVKIDGTDIRSVATNDLRAQIGLVTQDTMLFNDTIYENIRYGNPSASPQEIEAAAEQAHVTSFIDRFPDGMQTEIGIGGKRLSGGQRQRIALARAIVRNPSILILDEATSAVDAQSEDMINGVLKKFAVGRTVFIITHVLSETFLDLVDRIVVMDQGQIIATGSHNDLLDSCAIYRGLTQAGINRSAA